MPAPLPVGALLVMQPTLKRALQAMKAATTRGAEIAREQRQHVGAADVVAEGLRLLGEERVERGGVDFRAFDPRPGVGVGIDRVDAADDVDRQAALALVAVEGVEGRCREHTAEIPDHRLDSHVAHPACKPARDSEPLPPKRNGASPLGRAPRFSSGR